MTMVVSLRGPPLPNRVASLPLLGSLLPGLPPPLRLLLPPPFCLAGAGRVGSMRLHRVEGCLDCPLNDDESDLCKHPEAHMGVGAPEKGVREGCPLWGDSLVLTLTAQAKRSLLDPLNPLGGPGGGGF